VLNGMFHVEHPQTVPGGFSDVSRETFSEKASVQENFEIGLDAGLRTGDDSARALYPGSSQLMALFRRGRAGEPSQAPGEPKPAWSVVGPEETSGPEVDTVALNVIEEETPATLQGGPTEAPEDLEASVVMVDASPQASEAPESDDGDLEGTSPSTSLQASSKSKSKKKGSKGQSSEKSARVAPTTPRVRITKDLPRIMAVANQKGGVGKTTTTVNLGAALAEIGYRVLVVDLDPQGNATTGLGIERKNFEHSMYDVIMHEHPLEDVIEPTAVKNLFVAPATLDLSGVEIELVPAFSRELRLRRAIDAVAEDFDFVMIDCPPSLGLITINALAAAREVLVPIQCEYYALEGLSQLRSTLKLVGSNLNQELELSTIVLTMYDSRTNLAADVAADVREHFPDEVCDTIIPRTVRISEAPSFGQPITVFDPRSLGAESYRELAKEVSNGAPKRAG